MYPPNKDEPRFFDNFFSSIANFSQSDIVLGGDWNLVLDNQLDKDGGPTHGNKVSKQTLISYMNLFGLSDIFRKLNPFKKAYTRMQSQPYTATRLDFFLTCCNFHHQVQSVNICQSVKSDHKIVVLKINIDTEHGRGYWKFNNDILNDGQFIAQIKNVIHDFKINNPKGHVSPHIMWECLKCIVRGETIKYCSWRKQNFKKQQSLLEAKLNAMELRLNNCDPTQRDTILSSINNAKNDLDKLIETNAKGAAIRSRACWIEFGEKNSKYFLSLEKWRNDKKSIKSLRNARIIN